MNKYKKALIAAFVAAFAITASAQTVEEAYIAQYANRTDIPRPIKVVSPYRNHSDTGSVRIQFKVSPSGAVHGVEVLDKVGSVRTFTVVDAVRAWKFEPRANQTGDTDVALTVNFPAL
ncbi:MAG TPA: energy transducer TonB [Opitutaceae bacterium]|nr:energy transducer TonB [Opitutaceae bacterium]